MNQSADYKHEPKACPRCKTVFECKVGYVERCQCQSVRVTEEARKRIGVLYDDCLCSACLREMEREISWGEK